MYDITDYGRMLAHEERINAYAKALERVVDSDSVVVDIGTGTGIFALIAARLSARRVFAIDPNDAIEIAREIVTANGYGDRVECIQDVSTNVDLPEPATIVVSDITGTLPLMGGRISALVDARERLLSPGGVLIPQADALFAALAESPRQYSLVSNWDNHNYGFDMSPARELTCNTWWKERRPSSRLLTEPQCWARLDYTVIVDSHTRGEFQCEVMKSGTAHGVLVWFDTQLVDGMEFSGSMSPRSVYGRVFFPLRTPVDVATADSFSCRLTAEPTEEDYTWRWQIRIVNAKTGHLRADFDQSTLEGVAVSASARERQPSCYMPRLDAEGEIVSFVLDRMSGELTLAQIAEKLFAQFPDLFEDADDALRFAASLSQQYAR
jgi:precorrin-6B methylase 2